MEVGVIINFTRGYFSDFAGFWSLSESEDLILVGSLLLLPELLISWPMASSSTNADWVCRIVSPLLRYCSLGPSAMETYLSPIIPLVLTAAIASVIDLHTLVHPQRNPRAHVLETDMHHFADLHAVELNLITGLQA